MMRALYPASNDLGVLSDDLITLKIARHTPCELCEDCLGLHPTSHAHILRDGQLELPEDSLTNLRQYGSDEEDNGIAYIRLCGCGHTPRQHGANGAELGEEEFTRRANLALRIDRHLEVRFPFWYLSSLNTPVKPSLLRAEFQPSAELFFSLFDTHKTSHFVGV
jgi:hypothetical protein